MTTQSPQNDKKFKGDTDDIGIDSAVGIGVDGVEQGPNNNQKAGGVKGKMGKRISDGPNPQNQIGVKEDNTQDQKKLVEDDAAEYKNDN